MPNYGMPKPADLIESRKRAWEAMAPISAKLIAKDKLTSEERAEFDRLNKTIDNINEAIKSEKRAGKMARKVNKKSYVSGRERTLRPEQSFKDFAEARGYYDAKGVPTDFDWDAFWAAKFTAVGIDVGQRVRANTAETRAITGLGENISSGSGAGSAVVAQIWSHDVIDLVRQKCWSSRAGAQTVPLQTQLTNLPILQADVAPTYLAESNAAGLDISPALGTLVMDSSNGWVDMTAISKQVLEDAICTGGIDGLIRHSIAMKFARVLDQVALYGQVGAPANQAPGLINEASLLTSNVGGTPTTYIPISTAAAKIRGQGIEPNAIVAHPITIAMFGQLQDTLHQPMRPTPDVQSLWSNVVDSGLLNQGTEAGSSSSLYIGDFQDFMFFGIRLDGGVEVIQLNERLAEFGQIGFISRFRGSIRYAHPNQAFVQAYGMTGGF